MVDIATLHPGDRVKIVDKWRLDGLCGENTIGKMNKYLGTIMTVRDVDGYNCRMCEDEADCFGNGWVWNKYCIDHVVSQNTKEFRPGDRVRYISDDLTDYNEELVSGCCGTVVSVDYDQDLQIGVQWDHRMSCGHDLYGNCPKGYGYWVAKESICHIEDDDDNAQDVDEVEFGKILGEM